MKPNQELEGELLYSYGELYQTPPTNTERQTRFINKMGSCLEAHRKAGGNADDFTSSKRLDDGTRETVTVMQLLIETYDDHKNFNAIYMFKQYGANTDRLAGINADVDNLLKYASPVNNKPTTSRMPSARTVFAVFSVGVLEGLVTAYGFVPFMGPVAGGLVGALIGGVALLLLASFMYEHDMNPQKKVDDFSFSSSVIPENKLKLPGSRQTDNNHVPLNNNKNNAVPLTNHVPPTAFSKFNQTF